MLLVVVLFQIINGKEIDWSKFPHRPMVECECAVNVQLRGISFKSSIGATLLERGPMSGDILPVAQTVCNLAGNFR